MAESPTLALRKQIITNGHISMTDDFVMVGDTSYPISAKTTYTDSRDQPYTLGSIFYLYSTRDLDYDEYIAKCYEKGIPHVSLMNKDAILEDLLSPLPLDKISVVKPVRMNPIDISRIISEYKNLKKTCPTGVQYILLPKEDSYIRSAVFKNSGRDGFVRHRGRNYQLIHGNVDAELIDRIAAVFLDGSVWQINEWPSALTDRMKYIPAFYLALEGNSLPPNFSFPITVLRTEEVSGIVGNGDPSSAFWSVMRGRSASG